MKFFLAGGFLLALVLSIVGCETGYNVFGTDDVDRLIRKPVGQENTICLYNGFDSVCTLVFKGESGESGVPEKRVYVFTAEADAPRSEMPILHPPAGADGVVEIPESVDALTAETETDPPHSEVRVIHPPAGADGVVEIPESVDALTAETETDPPQSEVQIPASVDNVVEIPESVDAVAVKVAVPTSTGGSTPSSSGGDTPVGDTGAGGGGSPGVGGTSGRQPSTGGGGQPTSPGGGTDDEQPPTTDSESPATDEQLFYVVIRESETGVADITVYRVPEDLPVTIEIHTKTHSFLEGKDTAVSHINEVLEKIGHTYNGDLAALFSE